ncbi:MAG: hypothetical protein LC776_13645 [Acidobacteria bacterium]|nr:hypothetical protein [Acidobacteriota bacterium]
MIRQPTLKRALLSGAIAVAAVACAPTAPAPSTSPIAELAGRTAGAPQRCVLIEQAEGLRLGDSHTILYGRGGTVWVNRLASNCAGLDRSYVLAVEPVGSQHCRGDLVRSFEPISRTPGPACILADFVPYRR